MTPVKLVHWINCVAWLANAAVWAFHAGSKFMAVASLLAAVGSFWLSRND